MFGKSNYKKGMTLYNSGDYNDAINKLDKAIKSGDLDANETYTAYVNMGICYNNLKNFGSAIIALISALQLENTDFVVYSELGKAYYGNAEYERSLEYIEKAIELNSDNFELWAYKGSALCDLERYDDAEPALKTALKYAYSQDPEKIDSINQVIYVTSLRQKYSIGLEHEKNHKYQDAINVYDSILNEIHPLKITNLNYTLINIRVNSLYNKGRCLNKMRKYDSALEVYNSIIDFAPNYRDLYIDIADCYLQLDMLDDALKCFAKAEYYSDNENERIRIISSKYSMIIGRHITNKDYKAALNKANLIPETNDVMICWKKIHIGMVNFYLENYDEALKYLLPYADTDITDALFPNQLASNIVYTYLGGVYYKQKKYSIALKYLTECIKREFTYYTNTWIFTGECYIALGEYEKAIEALQNAVNIWDEPCYYDLAYLESRLNFAKEKLGYSTSDEAECPVCPKCGAKVVPEDTFCRKCGNKLNENN